MGSTVCNQPCKYNNSLSYKEESSREYEQLNNHYDFLKDKLQSYNSSFIIRLSKRLNNITIHTIISHSIINKNFTDYSLSNEITINCDRKKSIIKEYLNAIDSVIKEKKTCSNNSINSNSNFNNNNSNIHNNSCNDKKGYTCNRHKRDSLFNEIKYNISADKQINIFFDSNMNKLYSLNLADNTILERLIEDLDCLNQNKSNSQIQNFNNSNVQSVNYSNTNNNCIQKLIWELLTQDKINHIPNPNNKFYLLKDVEENNRNKSYLNSDCAKAVNKDNDGECNISNIQNLDIGISSNPINNDNAIIEEEVKNKLDKLSLLFSQNIHFSGNNKITNIEKNDNSDNSENKDRNYCEANRKHSKYDININSINDKVLKNNLNSNIAISLDNIANSNINNINNVNNPLNIKSLNTNDIINSESCGIIKKQLEKIDEENIEAESNSNNTNENLLINRVKTLCISYQDEDLKRETTKDNNHISTKSNKFATLSNVHSNAIFANSNKFIDINTSVSYNNMGNNIAAIKKNSDLENSILLPPCSSRSSSNSSIDKKEQSSYFNSNSNNDKNILETNGNKKYTNSNIADISNINSLYNNLGIEDDQKERKEIKENIHAISSSIDKKSPEKDNYQQKRIRQVHYSKEIQENVKKRYFKLTSKSISRNYNADKVTNFTNDKRNSYIKRRERLDSDYYVNKFKDIYSNIDEITSKLSHLSKTDLNLLTQTNNKFCFKKIFTILTKDSFLAYNYKEQFLEMKPPIFKINTTNITQLKYLKRIRNDNISIKTKSYSNSDSLLESYFTIEIDMINAKEKVTIFDSFKTVFKVIGLRYINYKAVLKKSNEKINKKATTNNTNYINNISSNYNSSINISKNNTNTRLSPSKFDNKYENERNLNSNFYKPSFSILDTENMISNNNTNNITSTVNNNNTNNNVIDNNDREDKTQDNYFHNTDNRSTNNECDDSFDSELLLNKKKMLLLIGCTSTEFKKWFYILNSIIKYNASTITKDTDNKEKENKSDKLIGKRDTVNGCGNKESKIMDEKQIIK